MRRTTLAALLLAVFAAACDTPPTATPMTAPGAPRRAAVTSRESQSFPIDLDVHVACANGGTGEDVLLSGSLRVVFHVTISSSGHVTVKNRVQPRGIRGTGLTTG